MISQGENLDSDGSSARITIADDDLLDVLANYGSPTETHSFEAGSPVMDAAPDCTSTSGSAMLTDQQRGSQPGGRACDLRVYEEKISSRVVITPIVVLK